MDSAQEDAVTHLGGLALGQVLQDLGVVGNDSDLQRLGLGGSKAAAKALDRDQIYRNDFDEELDEAAKEDEAADEAEMRADAQQQAAASLVPSGGTSMIDMHVGLDPTRSRSGVDVGETSSVRVAPVSYTHLTLPTKA